MKAVKNVLVFADGQIKEITQELIGNTFVMPEMARKDAEFRDRTMRNVLAKILGDDS